MSVLDVISTPLREGRLRIADKHFLIYPFQSTPLCEGRRLASMMLGASMAFQSTPLCEGRQQMFPDFLNEFRNTSTNFVVLDEICGCEVPGFEGERHENVVRRFWGFYDSLGFARSALRR